MNMNAFGLSQEAYDALPVEETPYGPAINAGDVIHAQRRARAQAQPRVVKGAEGAGRFVSPFPHETPREARQRLQATIAERDAELMEAVDNHCQERLSALVEVERLQGLLDARNLELSAAGRSISEMAGTVRDQQAELTHLKARIARPELIPMPAMKLGIFIGATITMLVMTGLAYFTHLI